MLGNLMNALMQPGQGGQQSAGADMLSQVVGGLMGGQQGGGAPVNQLLSGLQQVMQAQTGQRAGEQPSDGAPGSDRKRGGGQGGHLAGGRDDRGSNRNALPGLESSGRRRLGKHRAATVVGIDQPSHAAEQRHGQRRRAGHGVDPG